MVINTSRHLATIEICIRACTNGLFPQNLESDLDMPRFTSLNQPTKSERGDSEQKIANVVIATGLSNAEEEIQIQALEVSNPVLAIKHDHEGTDGLSKLLRTKRIFTHTAVLAAPKKFLFIALCSSTESRLVEHLV